mmetsp:Transcript_22506/g.55784  ORF Transcript_22506/g.55784 Transcript_22506/m.55784 type:complete len:95 (-) Transcript_22506:461-745(-)
MVTSQWRLTTHMMQEFRVIETGQIRRHAVGVAIDRVAPSADGIVKFVREASVPSAPSLVMVPRAAAVFVWIATISCDDYCNPCFYATKRKVVTI